jgi:hypothetical protein
VPSHRDCPARRPAPQRTEARGCSPSCLRATCSASPRAPTHDGRHDPRLRRAPSTSSDRTGPAGGATTAHPTGDAEAVPQRSPLRDCREASEKDNSRGVTGAPARCANKRFGPRRPDRCQDEDRERSPVARRRLRSRAFGTLAGDRFGHKAAGLRADVVRSRRGRAASLRINHLSLLPPVKRGAFWRMPVLVRWSVIAARVAAFLQRRPEGTTSSGPTRPPRGVSCGRSMTT